MDVQDLLHTKHSFISDVQWDQFKLKSSLLTNIKTGSWKRFLKKNKSESSLFFVNGSYFRLKETFVDDKFTDFIDLENLLDLFEEFSVYFPKETPVFLVFTMMDELETILKYSLMEDFYSPYRSVRENFTPKEYLIDLFLKRSKRDNVIVFETCGFDLERNFFLMELVKRRVNGEELDPYYPYDLKIKPEIPKKLSDIQFKFI
jgi:hypothetical protein